MVMAWALETSNLASSDLSPPARSCLLNVAQQFPSPGDQVFKYMRQWIHSHPKSYNKILLSFILIHPNTYIIYFDYNGFLY